MENRIEFEAGWKQKEKENSSLGIQKLFDAVRNVYCKINHLGSTTHFPAYRTAEMLKDYKMKAEQQKAEALKFLLRRLTI